METDKIFGKDRGIYIFFSFLALFFTFSLLPLCSPAACLAGVDSGPQGKRIVVYYFHGDYRCPTCLKLEKFSRDAVEENFKKELSTGILQYRSVNVDRPENRHFVDDFGLFTKSLVVVEEDGGEVKRYKNLQKIWVLVRDEPAFRNYVRDEVKGFLQAVKGSKRSTPPPSGN